MKNFKFALLAALLLGAWAKATAELPSYDWYSRGYFSSAGWYPVEYHMWAHDPDGDFVQLRVDSHYERVDAWRVTYGTGDSYNKEIHGHGESVDCVSAARVYLTDTVDTRYEEIELVF
jgi:hypothetical protein